jgi:plastocyanin/uncharacterized membrane protein YozB (DUF420 family)
MQTLLGTRTAADINLAAQLLLLAGLLAGFVLARRKRFAQHANVQTAMVLLNLLLIAFVMVPSFYGYVIAGESTTGRVAQLMIGHGVLGVVVEGVALYLILRMRTGLIPKRFRIANIKLMMRTTLALWTALVLLGVGIYAERYLSQEQPVAASAPLLELRQLGSDLYVHAVELEDAAARDNVSSVKRHAEHLINLIEGKEGLHYGDNDTDGHLEDPGDGVGLLARLDAVVVVAGDPEITARADEFRGQLDRIVALSVELLGARSIENKSTSVAEIFNLAREANSLGVFGIDFAARELGVVEESALERATPTAGNASGVTIHEAEFLFMPEELTIPTGATVVWINEERPKHTATADDDRFDSGDQRLGDSYAYTFNEPGIYPYFCRYHGDVGGVGMAGVIVVE